MNSKILHLVYDVAEQVRDWAENLAESRNSNKNLRGYCAIASAELHKRLSSANIKAELHVWNDRKKHVAHVFAHVAHVAHVYIACNHKAFKNMNFHHFSTIMSDIMMIK